MQGRKRGLCTPSPTTAQIHKVVQATKVQRKHVEERMGKGWWILKMLETQTVALDVRL